MTSLVPRTVSRFLTRIQTATWSIAQAVSSATLVVITTGFYGRVFAGAYLAPLVTGAVLGATFGGLAAVRRVRLVSVGAASALGLTTWLIYSQYRPTTRNGLPTVATLKTLRADLWHGVPRLLTSTIPADPRAGVLSALIASTWLASCLAVVLAIRTRAPLLALAPGLVALLAALLLTASSHPVRFVGVAAWLAVAVIAALLRANPPLRSGDPATNTRNHLSRFGSGALVVVVVTVLATASGILLPIAQSRNRFDPRPHASAPVTPSSAISPLDLVQGQHDGPVRKLFTVRIASSSNKPAVNRIRVAALDGYDGWAWSVDGRFQRAGSVLPEPSHLVDPISQSLTLSTAATPFGNYLPAVGVPLRVKGVTTYFDASSQQLIYSAPPRGAVSVSCEVVVPSLMRAEAAAPDPLVPHALPAPLPNALTDFARRAIGTAATPAAQLTLLQKAVRAIPLNRKAAAGSSYFDLLSMLDPADGGGNIEQHAALFAVLARTLGLPARAAVGYSLDTRARSGDRYTITSKDALAWAEVAMTGLGWVQYDTVRLSDLQQGAPPKVVPPPSVGSPAAVNAGPSRVDPGLTASNRRAKPVWVNLLGGLALAAGVAALAIATGKMIRRRRRRTRGQPAQQIVGAWREITDALREAGVPIARSMTVTDSAYRVQELRGRQLGLPIHDLAPILARGLYAPDPPTAADAADAWRCRDRFVRELRTTQTRWRLLIGPIDPRSLVYQLPQLNWSRLTLRLHGRARA